MKQTAVEFLIQQIVDRQNGIANGSSLDEIFQQALELEKQQIIDAYQWGRTDQHSKESKWYNRNAKKYYSETYKNEAE